MTEPKLYTRGELESKAKRRELYKAMRSAHDGICPLCGGHYVSVGAKRMGPEDKGCGDCGFKLTHREKRTIRSWHAEFHHDLEALLSRWREHGEDIF